jgi:hypothetical protein
MLMHPVWPVILVLGEIATRLEQQTAEESGRAPSPSNGILHDTATPETHSPSCLALHTPRSRLHEEIA